MRSGRPRVHLFDIRILALLDEQPFHSAYSIAEALGVSRSTILNYLEKSLGMETFHFRGIPHELTTSLGQIRMKICPELLPILKVHETYKFQRFVTEDQSWLTLEFHHSTKWSTSRDDVPPKVKQPTGTQKFMLTTIWGIDGFHVVNLTTEQHSGNIQYFLSYISEPLLLAVSPDGGKPQSRRLSLRVDN
jgi:hypothetical protein